MRSNTPRVALIHDWLTGMRGGEKVFEVLCDLFPAADVFTLVHVPGKVSPTIERHRIITSALQKVPGIARRYRHLLPLMPWAISQFDFTGYDVLISTSHCVAKGAMPPAGVPHWCYCHTPMRYIWDGFDDYFGPGKASLPVRLAMQALRGPLQTWDVGTVGRVKDFIANSQNVRTRIRRIYNRESCVIYPPVDTNFYAASPLGPAASREDFYLIVTALAPYKRVDLAIEACRRLKRRLIIIGEGQDAAALRQKAGSHVQFLGWRSNEELRDAYERARALLFPGEEDFGIVPLEAMAAGCPVIAFGRGGALETVLPNRTGLHFAEPNVESLLQAMQEFEQRTWDPQACRAHAAGFGRTRCEAEFRALWAPFLPPEAQMS